MKQFERFKTSVLLVLTMLPASGAMGAVALGIDYTDGSFGDVNYGDPVATGLAYVNPVLYADGLIDTPKNIGTTTLLSYAYSVSGLGSSRMEVTYSVTNDDISDFNDLRFMVEVDPNGNLAADPTGFTDTVSVVWGAQAAGDPDNYQLADYSDDLLSAIYANNGLNGGNTCPGNTCDVDFALQWNLASLAPGEIWNITIGLSDDGSALSSRYLRADSVDAPTTSLTFSGTATVIPLPATIYLLGSGLLGLVGIGGRLRHQREKL
jgi:hypothetical protein